MDNQSRDLLNADELLAEPLVPASRMKRFLNSLIDTVFFYILLSAIGVVFVLVVPGGDAAIDRNPITAQLISILLFIAYYALFESWLGKTIGKVITKTKVVDSEGEKPDFKAIVGRSFARLIPFEAFSFLRETPTGIHDRMTNTMVVDDKPRSSFDRSLRQQPD